MKPKPSILLSSLIDYYVEDNTLRRNKNQLIAEITDLITITQFLQTKIPTSLKNIKQAIKIQQKNIKDLSSNLKSSTKQLSEDQNLNTNYNLLSSYNSMSHFTFNKQTDKDYVEKTVAEKQMKLKFLESQNLPQDFIWHKATRSIRDSGMHGKMHKDYSWHSYFNSKLNVIQIVTRKYIVYVSMNVLNKEYVWAIMQIKARHSQDLALWLMQYFEERMRPAIKAKYKQKQQENMLASIDKFAYYFELLQFQQLISQIVGSQRFCSSINYPLNNKQYLFQFSKPQDLGQPILTITLISNSEFKVKLLFLKKYVKAIFCIQNIMQFQTQQQFKIQNPQRIILMFDKLIQYGERYIKFSQKRKMNTLNYQNYFFIRLNGVLWVFNPLQCNKNLHYYTKYDGIYIGKQQNGKLAYVSLNVDGSISSKNILHSFLDSLIKHVSKIESMLYFVYLIENLLRGNQQMQSQLDYYVGHEDKRKVFLYFRKKICIEDQMIRSSSRSSNNLEQDNNQSNFIKNLVEINYDFTDINFYTLREREGKGNLEKQDEWSRKFKEKANKEDTDGLLNVQQVIASIKYIQQHHMIKYVYDRKFKIDPRPSIIMKL